MIIIMLENPKSIVWIGGDFNLPNINWIDNSISNNAYPLSFCNLLLDTFDTFRFQQLVTFPPEDIRNTLDIFATNQPSLVEKM